MSILWTIVLGIFLSIPAVLVGGLLLYFGVQALIGLKDVTYRRCTGLFLAAWAVGAVLATGTWVAVTRLTPPSESPAGAALAAAAATATAIVVLAAAASIALVGLLILAQKLSFGRAALAWLPVLVGGGLIVAAGWMISLATQKEVVQVKQEVVAEIQENLRPVPEADRARARQAVQHVWDTLAPRLGEIYGPQDANRDYYLDLLALTRFDHRLAGYGSEASLPPEGAAGSIAAGEYVANRLRAMGVEIVLEQEFPVVQPVSTKCELQTGGKTYPLWELRPNTILPSITPAEGLTGMTLYVGKGEGEDYGHNLPRGRIVVLDEDCATNWLTAFAFGAKAVVFIGQDAPVDKPYLHVNLPANLPRFYVTAEQAEELQLRGQPREVTIRSAAQWRQLTGRNVVGIIRGTNPKFGLNTPPHAMILAANLDSLSEVPRLSPGARDAANVAALLRLAEKLLSDPPRRDVVLCFFDGETIGHAGSRAFYSALTRVAAKAKSIEARIRNFERERDFHLEIIDYCAALGQRVAEIRRDESAGKLAKDEPVPLITDEIEKRFGSSQLAQNLLKTEARTNGDDVMNQLRPLRLRIRDIRHTMSRMTDEEESSPRAAELQSRLDALRQQEKQLDEIEYSGWNRAQRDLHRGALPADREIWGDVLDRLDMLMRHVTQLQRDRNSELEQDLKEMRQELALRTALGPAAAQIVLHLAVNFGDSRTDWSFIHGDDSIALGQDTGGVYSQIYDAMRTVYKDAAARLPLFYDEPIKQTFDSRVFAPAVFSDSGATARTCAIFNFSAMTVADRLPSQGQSCDRVEFLKADRVLSQADELAVFFRKLADSANLPTRHTMNYAGRIEESVWEDGKTTGPSVSQAGTGLRSQTIRGACVASYGLGFTSYNVPSIPPGYEHANLCITDLNGNFQPGLIHKDLVKRPVVLAGVFDSQGLITAVSTSASLTASKDWQFYAMAFPTRFQTLVAYGTSQGGVGGTIAMRGASTSRLPADRSLVCEGGNVLTLFAPEDAKSYKLFNIFGIVALNNAADDYMGEGMSLADPFERPFALEVTCHDLRVLNEYRLSLLRRNRINQASLEELNGEGKDTEAEGRAKFQRLAQLDPYAVRDANARRENEPNLPATTTLHAAVGDISAAPGYYKDVYSPLVGVMNDLVTAVVLLLLLAMPFAYALERLLIGTPHIYRQIGWFGGFFLATFVILYLVNPAFKIASTPIIIFLAFTIILLSALVILIMVRKLQTEIKRMQGLAATVHAADVSRLGTMMAAVNMGISTMRRRPVRTILTATTVVLLTFTILTFASFGTSWGVGQTFEAPMSGGPVRIVIRHPMWNPIPGGIFPTLTGRLAGEANVVPRYWISPTASQSQQAVAENKDLSRMAMRADLKARPVPLSAAIGLHPEDIRRLELDRFLDGNLALLREDGIFLTEAVRDSLDLSQGDVGKARVLFSGREFTFAGTVRYGLASETMLEGSQWMPVDYQSSGVQVVEEKKTATSVAVDTSDVQSHQFVPFPPDQVVVVSDEQAQRMGGAIRALCIYPDNPDDVRAMADGLAKITGLPVYRGDAGAVQRLKFTSLTQASGFRDLLIPVLLGGLIVFMTMLGSVSDREREIYTFSSLGLAPPHIASLFFAEAFVYATVGGMGGYLLGQIVARALGWLAGMGYVSVPTMNYSSTNAIVTILIVMCTVMISTIYPAMKASKSANPGIQRAWRIPKPDGDLYDLKFPFTVSAYDVVGVVSFLREHFENFSDTSLGVFATTSSHVFRQKSNDMLGLTAEVALAPFDLGVNQAFALLSQPSEIEGIDEVRILISRLSGAHGDWRRANRVFVNDLRKQLLIWRSLPDEVMDRYRQRTLEQWDNLPAEQVDAQTVGGPA